MLNWQQVASVHGTISGINVKGGLVKSLLCNTSEKQQYPNKIIGDAIRYYTNSRTQIPGVNALLKSCEVKNPFHVFEKLGVDKWRDLGLFQVESYQDKGKEVTLFLLQKIYL